MNAYGETKIFAGSSSGPFASKMCEFIGVELGDSETITFSDGNTFVRIGETVRDMDVYLVQSIALRPNDELVELLFWLDAFKRASAGSVTAIIPYFGYAKGDKKDEPRVSIRARVCADAIEMAGADRVVAMDLHSPQIQGFFRKPVDHLYALPILCEFLRRLDLENPVIVSPDSGFAKQARRYASYLDTPVAICDKTRKAHDEKAEILDIVGEVDGKSAVIVDDFSISGRTLSQVAAGLRRKGAKRVLACTSHALLSQQGVKEIEESPIELLVTTDTVNNPWIAASGKITTVSVAPLFAESIARIHSRESVSVLFDSVPARILEACLGPSFPVH